MTLDDLAGRNFATTAEVAQLLDHADPRTIRRMTERGEIPCIRVGTRILVPVSWLRDNAGFTGARGADNGNAAAILPEQLAAAVADRVVTMLAHAFAALAGATTPEMATAGPNPGPAATANDPAPAKERNHAHSTPAG